MIKDLATSEDIKNLIKISKLGNVGFSLLTLNHQKVFIQGCVHDVQLAEEATHDDRESNEHLTGERRGAEEPPGS